MNYKDYYAVMGLKQDASVKEIKTAYRKLARKYHPDISKEANAEEKFKELGEAYDVLKDPKKRKLYDQYGKDWQSGQQPPPGQQQYHWDNKGQGQQFEFNEDFFESIFGAKPRQQRTYTGPDYHSNIEITLEEAYQGVEKELQFPALEPGKKPQALKVKIPAGVKTGQQIRLSGQGGAGVGGGKRGDLYLKVHVQKHALFDVKGDDIYLTLPITPWEAALGTKILVPTLGGKVDLKIPPGSQAGQQLRLKGRGLSSKTKGDQYILLKIVIPQPETDTEKALYQKMAAEMPFNPRESMGA